MQAEDGRSAREEGPPASRFVVLPGPWTPPPTHAAEPLGFLVVNGLMQRGVALRRTGSLELLGPRDVLLCDGPDQELMGTATSFYALTDVELVRLDDVRLSALRRRPEILESLFRGAVAQCRRAALHRVICQQPRVEDRLLAMFWLLASRWGRVGVAGVSVPIKLGHEALGHMVGARRPTVSLALGEMELAGSIRRLEDRTWLLDPATQDRLSSEVSPPSVQTFMYRQPPDLRPRGDDI